jgi:hypothetical protein
MPRPIALLLALGALLLVASREARADGQLQLGARVGGYGFREQGPADGGRTDWNVCRMNGIGVFGEYRLGGPWFVESGLDAYFSDDRGSLGPAAGGATSWPIERTSGLLTVAGGARLTSWRWFQPYVQLGVGMEVTRVRSAWDAPAPIEEQAVQPLAFFGIGGDLVLSSRFAVGASFRLDAMGLFRRNPDGTSFERSAELATQGQFYAKFSL